MVVVHNLVHEASGSVVGWSLLCQIHRPLQQEWNVKILHISREANRCTNVLASLGCEGVTQWELHERPPLRVAL